MLRTRFTEMFSLQYPIMSAPMTEHSGGTLAAAVSAAGGLGSFGALTDRGPQAFREQVALARSKTSRPFAVGFLTHFLTEWPAVAGPFFDAAVEERVPAIAFSFADPKPYVERTRAYGGKVICQAQTLRTAQEAVDAGTDVLVIQGNEAGGHTGPQPLLPFLIEARQAWPDIPLLAAGGIATGPALAAVLAAGADGVWMGTAFVSTFEAVEVPETYKQKIIAAKAEDSIYTRVFDMLDVKAWGIPPWPQAIAARVLRNETVDQWQGREDELAARIEAAAGEFKAHLAEDEMRWRPIYAGPSAGAVHSIRPAADVVSEICDDAEAILRDKLPNLLA
jgi:nitronate monooxygenase